MRGIAGADLLTTVGARTGRLRQTVLAFIPDGEDLVVVGSNYGLPAHPSSHRSLMAQRAVTAEVSGERFRCRARTADGRERDLLYARLAEGMPDFVAAQRRTDPQQSC